MRCRSVARRKGQQGYILLVVLLFVTILLMSALIAAPRIGHQIQREREDELIKRGTQYARAIGRFYKKFGRYPTRLEELENTNNLRFLRRRYKDPMTGKDDWKLIHFGQATVTPRGFGGAGAPPVLPGAAPAGGAGGGAQPQAPGTPATSLSRPPGSGPTFGGGPIVGVASKSEASSIKELNGKTRYNEWEFVYDPRLDPAMQGRGGVPQQGQPGQPQPGQPGQPRGPGGPQSPQPPGPVTPRQ
jgi:type II secretory pathway pseudopilin PulG